MLIFDIVWPINSKLNDKIPLLLRFFQFLTGNGHHHLFEAGMIMLISFSLLEFFMDLRTQMLSTIVFMI